MVIANVFLDLLMVEDLNGLEIIKSKNATMNKLSPFLSNAKKKCGYVNYECDQHLKHRLKN